MPVGSYRIAAVGKQLGVGVSGSVHVTVDAVAKSNTANAPYCVANELVCAEIGRFLRLPVPPGGIVTSAHHPPMFASLNFNIAGVALPPADLTFCVNQLPHLSTGLLLFDILIANSDRHAGNLAIDALASPAQMNVFDHSHALFGQAAAQGQPRLAAMIDRLAVTGGPHTGGNRHCLLDILTSDQYFQTWLERIVALPNFLIDDVCEDALPFGISAAESQAAAAFLKQRRDTFVQLVKNHQAEFHGITTWNII